jgi:hypothetical protein
MQNAANPMRLAPLAGSLLLLAVLAPPLHAGEGGATPVPPAKTRAIGALLARIPGAAQDPESGRPGAEAAHVGAFEATDRLLRLLGEDEAAWSLTRPRLVKLLHGTRSKQVGALVLKLLLFDPTAAGPRVAKADLAAHPERFDVNLLIKAYERGIAEAAPRLRKLCRVDPERPINPYPAVALAMRADPQGREALEAILAVPSRVRNTPDDWFAAAAGLAFLGDTEAWKRALTMAQPELERRLAGGNGVYAGAWYALGMEYFRSAVRRHQAVSVAFMSWPVIAFARAHVKEYDTAQKVRSLVRDR